MLTSSVTPPSIETKNLTTLTACRFIAAMLVVICHNAIVWETSGVALLRDLKANGGRYGVSFFFVLSGFILTHRYADGSSLGDLKRYFRARIARIVPMYWLCLAISLGAFMISSRLSGTTLEPVSIVKDVALKALFLQAIFAPQNADFPILQQGWTLSVEIAFYLLFPFILNVIQKWSLAKRLWLLAPVIGIHLIANHIQWHVVEFNSTVFHYLAWSPIVHFPLFMLGMTLRQDTEFWSNCILSLPSKIVTALLLVIWGVKGADMHNSIQVLVMLWITSLIIIGAARNSTMFKPNGIPELLGHASYGLYLLHGSAAAVTPFILKKLHQEPRLEAYPYFVLSSLIGVLCSCVLYRLFESPMRKLISNQFPKIGLVRE